MTLALDTSRGRGLSRPAFLRDWAPALVFIGPALVLMLGFKIWPIGAAIHAAGGIYDPGGNRIGPAGWDNLSAAVADPRFRHGLWLSLLAVLVKVPVQVGLGLAAALVLQANTRGNAVARALIVSPMFLGLPVTTFLFAYLFDLNVGLVNALMSGLGLPRVAWLTAETPAQILVLGLSVWRDLGVTMLVFLAGLTAIPPHILDAARLDGAGPRALLLTMVAPPLGRSVQFAAVLATLASFQMLVPVLILTKGGPNSASDLASFQVYETGFVYFDPGLASAMSLFLIAGLVVLIIVQLRLLRVRWTYE